jgi:excisionase family DNA binding protein
MIEHIGRTRFANGAQHFCETWRTRSSLYIGQLMHSDQFLNVDEAAKLIFATPDTLLQYIRRGELPAARVGKHMIIVYDDLLAFVKATAARQTAARIVASAASNQSALKRTEANRQSGAPGFVFSPLVGSPSGRRRGRRKSLPQLPADSINDA